MTTYSSQDLDRRADALSHAAALLALEGDASKSDLMFDTVNLLRSIAAEARSAVLRYRSMDASDPEMAHADADALALGCVPSDVKDAYDALVERSPWWASA